jgi:hypothetical protein
VNIDAFSEPESECINIHSFVFVCVFPLNDLGSMSVIISY